MGEKTSEVQWASMKDMPSLANWSMAGFFSHILALNAETESIPMSSPRIRMMFGLSGAATVEDVTAARMAMLASTTANIKRKCFMPLRLTIGPCQGKGAFINCPQGLSRGGMKAVTSWGCWRFCSSATPSGVQQSAPW